MAGTTILKAAAAESAMWLSAPYAAVNVVALIKLVDIIKILCSA
jgi:hypothetical protein